MEIEEFITFLEGRGFKKKQKNEWVTSIGHLYLSVLLLPEGLHFSMNSECIESSFDICMDKIKFLNPSVFYNLLLIKTKEHLRIKIRYDPNDADCLLVKKIEKDEMKYTGNVCCDNLVSHDSIDLSPIRPYGWRDELNDLLFYEPYEELWKCSLKKINSDNEQN